MSEPQYMPEQSIVQQVPITSDEIYAGALQEDKIRNIISQISPENQLADIEMRIRGFRKDPYSGSWTKIEGAKGIPQELIGKFMSFLSGIMNQNTTFANISEQQVNKIMHMVIEFVVDDLEAHAEEYGIEEDYTERTRICHIMWSGVFMTLTRAVNGSESRRMWKSMSLAESSSGMNGNPQKSEWWKFWKK